MLVMQAIKYLIFFFAHFTAVLNALVISGKLDLPQESLTDPARVWMSLSNDTWSTRCHLDRRGEFSTIDLEPGNYSFVLRSLDFALSKTNFFRVEVNGDFEVFEVYPGIAATANPVPLQNKLNFTTDSIIIKSFADEDQTASILKVIPFWGLFQQYPILGLVLAAMALIALLPTLISFIDPEFTQRALETRQHVKDENKAKRA
ncbi:hypothetical protein OGATHE_002482 [Ogataea polymorpha]|uniref:ER membrane protein complex subunit 7 beta-sandwich domain-containing protein n=1 Tax=Ogataea polymorpha TaxID=460523 RepID=A0A9P8PDP2_9ASCO|nr:hypothetical protein OGATHE_002482 [Ogataea polymorpha]